MNENCPEYENTYTQKMWTLRGREDPIHRPGKEYAPCWGVVPKESRAHLN